MKNSDIPDVVFREAVEAIDAGNIGSIRELLEAHPDLAARRSTIPADGYFKHPYLLWFVADNPIRHERLPANIVAIAKLIIDTARNTAAETLPEQLDYTLGLVATGRIPRECGVQIDLIDLLIDEGATPGGGLGAVAHGNLDAARHLIERGGERSLTVAVCLDDKSEIEALIKDASAADLHVALVAAAFYGKAEMIKLLIESGADVNGYPYQSSGFHIHATALHQAVCSGSLESVKLLVEAGADLEAPDKAYSGTPLGWAKYMPSETDDEQMIEKYSKIQAFLISEI